MTMIRRRRATREIAFSFDSFLDVVANVVGIILRLILVTWVGAGAYKATRPPAPAPVAAPAPEAATAPAEPAPLPEPRDPLSAELERQRADLERVQAGLLAEVRRWEGAREEGAAAARALAAVAGRREKAEAERVAVDRKAGDEGQSLRELALSLEELRARSKRVAQEVEALRQAPVPKRALRYRTPVSEPLQSEEVVFECRRGRVTLIDLGALLDEANHDLLRKAEALRTTWQTSLTTPAVGPFRLRYVLERERSLLDGAVPGAPDDRGNFRFGISAWEVVPLQEERGETADVALAPGSVFRRTVDALDAQQTAVTLWVYNDSFPLYRRLRDYLHEHDVVVAGRPLPEGIAIASSRRGSASRGQ